MLLCPIRMFVDVGGGGERERECKEVGDLLARERSR
jgi:hypothetical protein